MREIMTLEKLKEIVFQNLGEVSVCWSEIPKGIFDSTKAEKLGNGIIQAIKLYLEDELKNQNK
jgi:hypothetical protein